MLLANPFCSVMVTVAFVPLARQVGLSAIVPVKQPMATELEVTGAVTEVATFVLFLTPVTLNVTDPEGEPAPPHALPTAYIHTRVLV